MADIHERTHGQVCFAEQVSTNAVRTTNKKANLSGLAFLQIRNLPEFGVERAKGIEPSASAWEAEVLPLYDAREGAHSMLLGAVLQSFLRQPATGLTLPAASLAR